MTNHSRGNRETPLTVDAIRDASDLPGRQEIEITVGPWWRRRTYVAVGYVSAYMTGGIPLGRLQITAVPEREMERQRKQCSNNQEETCP